jgi:hypothetical protein
MRKNRYFKVGGKLLFGLAFASLIGSIIIAYINNFILLPWSSSLVIGTGFLSFILLITFGSVLLWFDTSWVTPRQRDMVASTPDKDTIVRVVTSGDSKNEFFIYGKPSSIIREILQKDWPFDEELLSFEWRVVDESGLDVSMKTFAEVDSIMTIVFN